MPGLRGQYAVVPRLSGAGHAAEPGGAGPGSGAGPPRESGARPLLGDLPVAPPTRSTGSPGTRRHPASPGDRAGVSTLDRVGDLLAGLGADHAGAECGGPGAAP